MKLTAIELIQLTKEIDEKCIDFAEWIVNNYYTNPNWEYKTIKELLEIYKKVKTNATTKHNTTNQTP